jgi:hypothetical protein
MPTILKVGAYRFFFYSNEKGEPPHIHVQRERKLAKLWLQPVTLVDNNGFPANELKELLSLVTKHQHIFKEAWDEFFGI